MVGAFFQVAKDTDSPEVSYRTKRVLKALFSMKFDAIGDIGQISQHIKQKIKQRLAALANAQAAVPQSLTRFREPAVQLAKWRNAKLESFGKDFWQYLQNQKNRLEARFKPPFKVRAVGSISFQDIQVLEANLPNRAFSPQLEDALASQAGRMFMNVTLSCTAEGDKAKIDDSGLILFNAFDRRVQIQVPLGEEDNGL